MYSGGHSTNVNTNRHSNVNRQAERMLQTGIVVIQEIYIMPLYDDAILWIT